jgi:hypothetical protein
LIREEHKLWSSSRYNFLQPPVTFSLLSPHLSKYHVLKHP